MPDLTHAAAAALELADWRRAIAELYAEVRQAADPSLGHETWRRGRDELFRSHPQSPLAAGDPLRESGLPYFPYDPSFRFELPVLPPDRTQRFEPQTSDGGLRLDLVGHLAVDGLDIRLDLWWIAQYGGGLFLPLRDGTAGTETYGGGRYLLDTAKGADLGTSSGRLVVDFNFLYHPSCRYSDRWACPLAPEGDRTAVAVPAGERLPSTAR
jgi:uncharacterized protein (DUF1684 family)